MKRVPIPLVILLSIGAVALPWWLGTRHMDFLKPPTEFQLARVRSDVASSFPKRERLPVAAAAERERQRAFQSPIKPAPAIDPGELHTPASLDAYREHAKKGAAAFIELAVHLEEQGANPRALLAWERVLDVCQPDAAQRAAAVAGIERLRPLAAPLYVDPREAKILLLEAVIPEGVPTETADAMEGVMAECATVLAKQSAGLLRFESRLERPVAKPAPKPPKKPKKPAKPETPVGPTAPPAPLTTSLQILLEGESSTSTGLIEIPLSADPESLRREILAGSYKLVSSQLAATTDFTPPGPLVEGDDPASALGTRITRLCWEEFGKSFPALDSP